MQKKVLICDDEPQLREMIASWLCIQGYSVVEAEDGIECWKKIEQHRPNIILLDLNMPRSGGLDVLRKLSQHELHIPVIVLSGSLGTKTWSEARRFGHDNFMQKPFSLDQVAKKIEDLCAN